MKLILILLTIALFQIAFWDFSHAKSKPSVEVSRIPDGPRFPQAFREEIYKRCAKEAQEMMVQFDSLEKWIEQAPQQNATRTLRTPTKTVGVWIETSLLSTGSPLVSIISSSNTLRAEFDSNCKINFSSQPGLDFRVLAPDSLASWFDDKALMKVLESKKEGLIYVWSPEMVYSAEMHNTFRDVAKSLDLEFISLIDPRTKMALVDKAIRNFGMAPTDLKLNSVELFMRNMTVHYPTSLVFKEGRISDDPLVGVMGKDELRRRIRARLLKMSSFH